MVENQAGEELCIEGPPVVWECHQCPPAAIVCVAMSMEALEDDGLTRVTIVDLLQSASDVTGSSEVPGEVFASACVRDETIRQD